MTAAPRKTYTNKATGKLMYVGGGAVPPAIAAKLRAAARRRAAAARPAPARPVNPLDAQVNAAIGERVKPLQGMLGEREKQYAAEGQLAGRANTALQGELDRIGGVYNEAKGQAIGAVGAGQVATEGEQARGNAFLQSVLGGFMPDAAQAAPAQAQNQLIAGAQGDLQNRTIAGQLALEQQAGNAGLAMQRTATGQQAAEFTRDRLDARNADTRTIQTQIAAIQAGAPALRRQFGRENEQMSLARQQLQLDRQNLGQNQSQFDANLAFQREGLASSEEQAGLDRETAAAGGAGGGAAASAASAKRVEAARSSAGTMVDNMMTVAASATGDPAAFAQLKKRLPGLKLGVKNAQGAWVLDNKKWKALAGKPSTITALFAAYKAQGLAPMWAFWAAQKFAPNAFPAGQTFDIKSGTWRKWTAQEVKQLKSGWKPVHYRYL